jgi:cytosine/adenosine deaminase-related metal-dependent hydrolase
VPLIVQGSIFDADGARPAYVRFEGGRVVEVGQIGTDSTRGRIRRLRGIVIPPPVNSHTHLGDAVSAREPPPISFAEMVGPPDGFKFRLLAAASPAEKRDAVRLALRRMLAEGIRATVDFREEGAVGVRALRHAARGLGIRVVALGRPLLRPVVPAEISELLEVADGIGLASAREESVETRRTVARACRTRGKRYALHASEERRERVETYLDPRPDLLVHLTYATRRDFEAVRDARTSVAVCPRSNALFGRRPALATMERLGLSVLLGTDNAMLHSPSIWRELEFAYVSSRLSGERVSSAFLARAALVEPWNWLGEADVARIGSDATVPPLVLRLPPEDPAYQVVTRATEQVIVQPGRRRWGARGV